MRTVCSFFGPLGIVTVVGWWTEQDTDEQSSPRGRRMLDRLDLYSYKGITSPPYSDPMLLLLLLLLLLTMCDVVPDWYVCHSVPQALILLFWSTASLNGAEPQRANVHVGRLQHDSCLQWPLTGVAVTERNCRNCCDGRRVSQQVRVQLLLLHYIAPVTRDGRHALHDIDNE